MTWPVRTIGPGGTGFEDANAVRPPRDAVVAGVSGGRRPRRGIVSSGGDACRRHDVLRTIENRWRWRSERVMGPGTGRLLVALPALRDPNFDRTVVLIVDHDHDGTLGVVLNRPSTLPLTEHAGEWLSTAAPPARVFVGGPVQPDRGLALAWWLPEVTPDETIRTVTSRTGVVDLDADPERVRAQVTGLRIFAGYAGWGPDQLTAEIAEGAWVVLTAEPGDVVHPHPERLWSEVLARQDDRLRILATYPDDVRAN